MKTPRSKAQRGNDLEKWFSRPPDSEDILAHIPPVYTTPSHQRKKTAISPSPWGEFRQRKFGETLPPAHRQWFWPNVDNQRVPEGYPQVIHNPGGVGVSQKEVYKKGSLNAATLRAACGLPAKQKGIKYGQG